MRGVLALAKKDLLLMLRDKGTLMWALAFPIVIGVMFGFAFGGDTQMAPISLAVVDQDGSLMAKALTDHLEKSDGLKVYVEALQAAQEDVAKGRKAAYLLIPKGYGEADPFDPSQNAPAPSLGLDPSRKVESGVLQGVIQGASFEALSDNMGQPDSPMRRRAKTAMSDTTIDPQLRTFLKSYDQFMASHQGEDLKMNVKPLKTEPVHETGVKPASPFEITFPQALIWGILGVISSFTVSIVREQKDKTLLRLLVSPLSYAQIMASKAIAAFVSVIGVMATLLLIGHFMFHVRLTNPVTLTLAIVCTAAAFVGLVMLLSTLGRTEQAVGASSWGVMMLMAMFGGGMLPLAMMPPWMRAVSDYSPLKWSTLAVEGAIWRSFSLADMVLPCSILIGVGIVTFVAGVKMLSRNSPT